MNTPDTLAAFIPDERQASTCRGGAISVGELALLALVLAAFSAARWPFVEMPLMRDEGEYAQLGQVIRDGWAPYRDVYNQKPPVVFFLLAAEQAALGEGLAALRWATTAWGLVTLGLAWWVARGLVGAVGALAAVAVMAALLFDLGGVFHPASTEFFMLLWCVAALACWYPSGRRGPGRLLAVGLFAALAIQTKQTGVALLVFLAADRLWSWALSRTPGDRLPHVARDLALVALGCAVAHVPLVVYLASQEVLPQYLECVWINNFAYIGHRHVQIGLPTQVRDVALYLVGPWSGIAWVAGLLGCLTATLSARREDAAGLGFLALAFFAFAGVAGTWYAQYFVPLALPLALGCGFLVARLAAWAARPDASPAAELAALALGGAIVAAPLVKVVPQVWNAEAAMAQHAAAAPFDESPQVAAELARLTAPDDPVLVLGTEPEIYFHAGRKPASRMVITYPAYGPYAYSPRLAAELTEALKNERLRYVVTVNYPGAISEFPDLAPDFKPLLAGATRVFEVRDRHYPDLCSLAIFRLPDR